MKTLILYFFMSLNAYGSEKGAQGPCNVVLKSRLQEYDRKFATGTPRDKLSRSFKLHGNKILKSEAEHLDELGRLGIPAINAATALKYLQACCLQYQDMTKMFDVSISRMEQITNDATPMPPHMYPTLIEFADAVVNLKTSPLIRLGLDPKRAEEIIKTRQALAGISLEIPVFTSALDFRSEHLIDLIYPINSYKFPHPDERKIFSGLNPRTFLKWRRNSRRLGDSAHASWGRDAITQRILKFWESLSPDEKANRLARYKKDTDLIRDTFNSDLSLHENFDRASARLQGLIENRSGRIFNFKTLLETLSNSNLEWMRKFLGKNKQAISDWKSGASKPIPKDEFIIWSFLEYLETQNTEKLRSVFDLDIHEATQLIQNQLNRNRSS